MKQLTDIERSALKEIGSIGASHASTALSKLINRPVDVELIHFDKILLKDIPQLVGGAEEEAVGIIFGILSHTSGKIIMLSDKKTSLRMAEMLLGGKRGSIKMIGSMERSALKEMGNILTGSYLASLSDFSGLNLIASTPVLKISKAKEIMKSAIVSYKVDFI